VKHFGLTLCLQPDAAKIAAVDTSRTRWGEVAGRASVGVAAPAGTPVWIVRRQERPLRARIVECEVLPEGRVRLVLEGGVTNPYWRAMA
jgi:hypothetical protein